MGRLILLKLIAGCMLAVFALANICLDSVKATEVHIDTKNDTSLSKVGKDRKDIYFRYINARFNYSIEFPGWLAPQPEAENGDGRRFINESKNCQMLAYGRLRDATIDGSKLTIKQAYKETLENRSKSPSKVTYKFLGKKSFVVSGLKGSSIFYEKSILDRDAIKTFSITYPSARAKEFQSTVEHIAGSFKSTIPEGKR